MWWSNGGEVIAEWIVKANDEIIVRNREMEWLFLFLFLLRIISSGKGC